MPKPPERWLEARSKICNLNILRNPALTQYSKAKSSQVATVILRLAELLTLLPYNKFASRLLDRALVAAEEGRRDDL